MTEQKQLACNFCGKYREDVEKLISGPDVYICNECVTLSYQPLSALCREEARIVLPQ